MALSLLWMRISEAYADPRASARRNLSAAPTWGEALTMVLLAMVVNLAVSIAVDNLTPREPATPVADRSGDGGAGYGGGDGRSGAREADLSDAGADRFSEILRTVALQGFVFLLICFLAWFIGSQAGGSASFDQVVGLVGWHALATVPLEVAAVLAMVVLGPAGGGLGPLILVGAAIYILYIFAAFIAEAHGFEQVGIVMAACFGVALGASFLTLMVLNFAGVLELA